MHHGSLEHYPVAPRITPEEAMFNNLRRRLQGVSFGLKDGDYVYINGEKFTAAHFRFMVDCLRMPKN